jgi:prepilin signal peptidase PulO-like enzyme (type II secretory pathway)
MTIIILIALVAFGMIFGSFANALIWRIHAQEEINEKITDLQAKKKLNAAQKKEIQKLQAELKPLSMAHGRSMCSMCRHPLAVKDLVPLFSWLSLQGKCRYCHEPIDDTPWLEALLPLAFAASYLLWPLEFTGYGLVAFGFWLVMLVGFATLTVYDLRWQILPDRVVWPLVAVALIQVLLHIFVYKGGFAAAVDAFWGVMIASGIFYVLYIVSKGEWIGGGDVKLGIVLGLLVGGPLNGFFVLFAASMLGTLVSLPQLVSHKLNRKSAIPFGPFLMAAAVIVVLFGQRFTDWFETFLLLG